ncbi:hypothetical protein OS493_036645 [Desmophyllum pertusum]|uniref:Uncharacterized protein n=1 Tax=Desmophyllum pertusum TaxID=174260 RepID=A0A9W9YUP8_9CNID|nr:hypothetical protein OS493_036645 [Desmophyllum pertusum]
MVPSENAPLYYEVSPFTKLMLRALAGITGLIVLITLIMSFVKAADDSMMYLIAVNMLISSVIGGVITWWYHKGIIEAKKVAFMAFVGVCIIFQAITSDIYVYNKKIDIESPTVIAPTPTTAIHASSIVPPENRETEENNPWIKKSLNNRWNFFFEKTMFNNQWEGWKADITRDGSYATVFHDNLQ